MLQPLPSSRQKSALRRKAPLWLALLYLIVLTGFSWLRASRPAPQFTEYGYYEGHLAAGRNVYLLLKGDGAKSSVTLHVEGARDSDVLEGKRDAAGRFTLKTIPYADVASDSVTEVSGSVSGQPPVFSGTMMRGKVRAPISMNYVAKLGHFQRKQSLNAAGRGGGKEFSADWPDFIITPQFHRTIVERLAAEARGETDQFMAGALGNVWEGVKSGGASWNYDGLLDTEIRWLSPDVVSLFQVSYEYTGGAHGSTGLHGRNFVRRGEKVKEFSLSDLFRPGSAWASSLSGLCLRDLRQQKAQWVLDGDVKGFKASDVASFTLDSVGVTIHFDPYAVGYGAQGAFHVVIPWRKVRSLLNPDGPAKFIPGALDGAGQ